MSARPSVLQRLARLKPRSSDSRVASTTPLHAALRARAGSSAAGAPSPLLAGGPKEDGDDGDGETVTSFAPEGKLWATPTATPPAAPFWAPDPPAPTGPRSFAGGLSFTRALPMVAVVVVSAPGAGDRALAAVLDVVILPAVLLRC